MIASLLTLLAIFNAPAAQAQSPTPNVSFTDVAPGMAAPSTNGVIVEGLGLFGTCAHRLAGLKSSTVQFINAGRATISEISPQGYCGTLSQYQSAVTELINYVEANAPAASRLWGGIMLDEEPDWAFTVTQLQTLNTYVSNAMSNTPGISWWYTENATWAGGWSQSQYNSIVGGSIAAPQIYNSYMVAIANTSGKVFQLVTSNANAQYPFNSAAYADGQINGAPYYQQFGTSYNFQWDNRWVAM